LCFEASFIWNDIGSWYGLWKSGNRNKQGNILDGMNIISNNMTNSYIKNFDQKKVIISDLDDIVVINDKDKIIVTSKYGNSDLLNLFNNSKNKN
ncbi:MAG TPA: hypothetical protein QKA14_01055, partial [Candidatus Megaira endosymbiont of Hartmannula sinica]|nr:hypothetical protein [Candidatus Megaera endosymbiont of Hartmannula sinica]